MDIRLRLTALELAWVALPMRRTDNLFPDRRQSTNLPGVDAPVAIAVAGRTADAGDVGAHRFNDGQVDRAQLAGQRGKHPAGLNATDPRAQLRFVEELQQPNAVLGRGIQQHAVYACDGRRRDNQIG